MWLDILGINENYLISISLISTTIARTLPVLSVLQWTEIWSNWIPSVFNRASEFHHLKDRIKSYLSIDQLKY